ncbi:MAG: adenosine kinase [Alphaproteobacteria bacterium]|nr:adenosine kinase [Alphaproteobacteria bacterium]
MNKPYHVVAIGNAIVDVLSFADDAFVQKEGMNKGTMCLIDEARAEELYNKMGPSTEVSGGSAANTLAGLASLGAKTAFIGKVYKDELGKIFRHDLTSLGVDFSTPAADKGKATARCLICVTPDGQRTMNTFIGACNELYERDIDEALIAKAQIVYGEGYMWDQECAKIALKKSFALAKQHGAKVAFTLSDVFCVERSRDEFLNMIENDFDILFCNEAEARALYPGNDFPAILDALQGKCDIIAITMSDKGSLILTKDKRTMVDAVPVREVVDTTGAGDLYAAGFLYGYVNGMDLRDCGRLGSACASDIITHLGARAQKSLKRLLAA